MSEAEMKTNGQQQGGQAKESQGHQSPNEDHGKKAPQVSGRTAVVFLLVLLLIAVVIVVAGIVPRVRARTTLKNDTDSIAAPDVVVEKPERGVPDQEIIVPGNMYAYTDSPIYARTSGYLNKWYFDIGTHVRKGALLATISSPEVDQQLLQARADLATAQANSGYAQSNAKRYQDLLQADAVTKQDTENFTTQAASSNTTVKSALANVQRLEALTSFERVYAPFDGVITSRAVDTGTLIDAGANRELFHLSRTDTLRVYVNIPQVYIRNAVRGVKAELDLAEYPGHPFTGTLVRTADAIDPASRTLLVEIDVDNRAGQLVPGAYTLVHLKVDRDVQTLVLPVSTLVFQAAGLQVATVVHGSDGNRVKMVNIALGHDDGKTVQVVSGLDENAQVIANPPDSISDGELVNVVPQPGPVPNAQGQNQNTGSQKEGAAQGRPKGGQ
jgi:RND family efflux transporter MFP subunit